MIWIEDTEIKKWLPILQAHRGFHKDLPENTLQSIQAAYDLGYEMAEFDVRLTLDEEIVLFHDQTHQGRQINEMTLEELRQSLPANRLEEVLLWLRDTQDFKLNIEIKSAEVLNYILEKKICELVRRFNLEDRILISSFNPLSLYKVRLFSPKLYRALLLSFEDEEKNTLLVKSGVLNYLAKPQVLHLRYDDYSNHFRTLAKKIPIVLWTVNKKEIYEKYAEEIHGIISDWITPSDLKKEN